jgi:hypothetical protein
MQMSRANIFIFVEGKTDRYFFHKICETVLAPRGIEYEICLAQELPQLTGGKKSLLDFFKYLDKTAALLDDFKGSKTAAIFYLDKDVDDILKKIISSDHVVYTEHYCIENYFFIYGDLVEATAVAADLDLPDVHRRLNMSNDAWRHRAAESWKDWIKLCVFTRSRNIGHECNYSVATSRINTGTYTSTDPTAYSLRLADLEHRSGLTPIGFKRVFGRISREIDNLYSSGRFDSVFKGKWYALFLADDAKTIAGGGAFSSQNLPDKLITSLKLTLDFHGTWATYFKRPLEDIIKRL